ncbi:LuxR family transcriptional regulator [Microbispora corallina]|uniref:LuxR family transcriptional regulator n=1 Tax=Microbispora corallina TaxID=83302 RepID=A0ABQ4FXK2_9ACTN|nr:tetratricopeptide repeat protein [Microbispora corallina]GIH39527.1 LuxR family transcriptional regulator [Microbispora corallina]
MDGSAAPAPGNLPAALTGLVGRDDEIERLASLLRATRLLTVTGTGGCGKTRLALALAERRRPDFPDGAWWVDLAASTEHEHVATAVAAALGVAQSPGEEEAATVIRHLRPRTALLVLDNCEQVVAAVAVLIDRLLTSCPGLTVVATSREVIGVSGETVFRLGGLRLPDGDGAGAEAVELFLQRARTADPWFPATPDHADAVARLCRRLDGLPLAIELAAARVGVLGVAEIADRLDRDAAILRHPSRTAPARHQTLQATLDWSHRLLTEPERILFRRLSAFQGTFSLAAAEAVAAGAGIDPGEVVDLLAGLVVKSLVLPVGRGTGYRYRMLETIRQYGERTLALSGEREAVHAAHADFYLGLAEEARTGVEGSDQARWLDLMEAEHDNVRAVLRRDLPSRPHLRAGMTALMWPFWYRRGYYHEARSWLEQAAADADGPRELRAAVLTGAGVLAFLQCDYPIACERLSKARALYEEAGDLAGLATALQRLGSVAREEGRFADARRLHEESLAIWTELGDGAGVAASLDYLGFAAWLEGDAVRAVDLCRRAVAAFRASGRRQETAAAMINLGAATRLTGETGRAEAILRGSLEIARHLGYQEGIAWALHELALTLASAEPEPGAFGDVRAPEPGAAEGTTVAGMLRESLATHLALGDRWRVASVVESIAEIVTTPVAPRRAAALLGAADALRRTLGAPVPPAERPALTACVETLHAALGARAFADAWRGGETMTLDEMADAAVEAGGEEPAAGGPEPFDAYGLTGRELAVLRLVSRGMTNREIAGELHISAGTAGVHVSNILRKLGVTSRVQAAAMVRDAGPPGRAG